MLEMKKGRSKPIDLGCDTCEGTVKNKPTFLALLLTMLACVTFAIPSISRAEQSNNASPTQLEKTNREANKMKIRFVFDDRTVEATLDDTPSTRDFVSQLPLTFDLEDYASTEKIAYLPRKLTTEGAPKGSSSSAGDIAYYAPWGNLVIFYKSFGYASGLIPLGKLDGGLERFTKGSSHVTIESAE